MHEIERKLFDLQTQKKCLIASSNQHESVKSHLFAVYKYQVYSVAEGLTFGLLLGFEGELGLMGTRCHKTSKLECVKSYNKNLQRYQM